MIWVKVCGITNLADAQTAAILGVDALGFIFTASKRQIERERVRKIITQLPENIEKIGVFLDQEMNFVRNTLEYCCLTGVQFHGSESPEYCREFKDYTVIKAFRVNENRGWNEITEYIQKDSLDRILLDTYVEGAPGGTGQTFPWSLVKSKNTWGNYPLIIAGGITPDNVARVIGEGSPFGIDVGSGVELQPGKKDRKRVKQLIARARACQKARENGQQLTKLK